ncbi:MAG: hypothetical protein AAB597_03500 [Patescibacteria group bacterium]
MPNPRRYLKVGLVILFILLLSVLVYYNSERLREGPVIKIELPKDGETVSNPLVTILGTVKNISYLTLNGRQVFVDQEGRLTERLLLPYGYSILTLEGRDRFGRTIKESVRLFYK